MINEIVFGMTAKQFRGRHPDAKGNLRDNAGAMELSVLAAIENVNTYLIRRSASLEARYGVLKEFAEYLYEVFREDSRLNDSNLIG